MNKNEGVRRIAIVIRWAGFLTGLFVASIAFYTSSWADKGLILLMAGVPVAVSQGLAWIVDGFAAPHK